MEHNEDMEQPDNLVELPQPSDHEKELMAKVEEAMKREDAAAIAGMVLLNWRIYFLLRSEMARTTDGLIDEEMFSYMVQALSASALQPYSVADAVKQAEDQLLPWLRRTALEVEDIQLD